MKGSYSQLITDITSGSVESIILIPERREVKVFFSDGTSSIVPIFYEDQNILRLSEQFNIPLTVNDYKREEALAGFITTMGFGIIFLIALSYLIRKSTKLVGPGGFVGNKAKLHSGESVSTTFDDVAGLGEATDELKEVVSFLSNPDKFQKLGAKSPKGILLIGPPGTGKTLLAKAIAGEAGVPFFSISGSEFVELFVGVGASRVRELFAKAKATSPCLVFIDEIDAVGRQRGSGIGGGNDEREQTLNQLLTEMDGFTDNSGIILLAATNRPDVLDNALTRPGRFDRRIYVDLPDKKARFDILSIHIRSKPFSKDISLNDLANRTAGFSGAELMNLLNEAAILTARNGKKRIGTSEIDQALEKISIGLCSKPVNNFTNRRLIAYQEVAKALVAHYLNFSDKLQKISILKSPASLGGTSYFSPDEDVIESGLITKSYLYKKIVICLAGRASELLVFGENEITQACQNDLEKVHSWAKEMIKTYGFSPLGPVSYDEVNNSFLGRDLISSRSQYSQKTMKEIDDYIFDLCKKSLNDAINLLCNNRFILDKIVDILVEEETIDAKRFELLINE